MPKITTQTTIQGTAQKTSIGIPVKHYSNSFSSIPIHHLCDDFGGSNTDKSTYRPDISLVYAQQGAATKTLLYDYPDGKDDGNYVMTYIRDKGLDVTEVQSAMDRVKSVIDEKIENGNKKDELLDSVKKIADSLTDKSEKGQDNPKTEQQSTN